MLTFFASCFHKVLSRQIAGLVNSKNASKFTNRDELSEKQSPIKQKKYYRFSLSSTKPLLKVKDEMDVKSSTGFDRKASTIRVKVKMTKQEAARLLSKCKAGGILEFKDAASELVNLPMNRVALCPLAPVAM